MGASHPDTETAPERLRGEPDRTHPGTRYASAYVSSCDAPLMMTEALFAASCNDFDDKWL